MNRTLLTLSVIFYLGSTTVLGEFCFAGCRFHFCDGRDAFAIPNAMVPFTGAICEKNNGPRIIEVSDNSTCEALVVKGPDFMDISTTGLPSTFFKTSTQDNTMTTVLRGPWPVSKEEEYKTEITGACIILPLDAWRMKFSATKISDIFTRHSNTEDCVSFRVLA